MPPRLRLLLVVDSLDGGGAELHVVHLAAALRRRGHSTTVACSADGVLAPQLRAEGIEVEVLGPSTVKRRFSPRYALRLRALVRRGGFDLVHAHIYASATAAAAAVAGTDVPLVITEHTEGPWRGPLARRLSALAYRRCDQLIAVSSAIDRLLRERYGIPRPRIDMVLPTPPEVPEPARIARRRSREPAVGRIARLQPEKGVDVFLRAAARVLELTPGTRFAVVGDGPLRGELAALAQRLGIAGSVDFLGYRPDARSLLARLDVLVVSSHTDGSPLVVLEAMAAGVPVVATAVGGVPDQLRHGLEGLLVPPGDHRAMADAVVKLVRDPALADRMARAGRRRVQALPHARMVDATERVYRQALLRRHSAAPSVDAPRHRPVVPSRALAE